MATLIINGISYRIGSSTPLPLPDFLPVILPASWRETNETWGGAPVGRQFARVYRKVTGLLCLVSAAVQQDGKGWLHVSVSRSDRKIPDWQTMSEIKNVFIGEERTALQIMPPKTKHVNIHPGVLHLWHCLDGDVTPDFTGGGETI